jgi:hypothetical protein
VHSASGLPAKQHSTVLEFIALLMSFSKRWNSLTLALKSSLLLQSGISTLSKDDVPLLESLHHYDDQLEWLSHSSTSPLCWVKMPGLLQGERFHAFSIFYWNGCTAGLSLPWRKLTQLELGRRSPALDIAVAWDILRQCPNLKRCAILVTCSDLEWHDETSLRAPLRAVPEVSLPLLNSLSIFSDRSLTRGYISALRAPQLQHLEYSSDTNLSIEWAIVTGGLKTLSVGSLIALNVEAVSKIIRANADVTVLHLVESRCTAHPPCRLITVPELLQVLAELPHISPSIELLVLEDLSVSDEVLLPILLNLGAKFSSSPVGIQRHIHVSFLREMETDIMPELEHLNSASLRVTLSYQVAKKAESRYLPAEGLRNGDPDFIFDRLQSLQQSNDFCF